MKRDRSSSSTRLRAISDLASQNLITIQEKETLRGMVLGGDKNGDIAIAALSAGNIPRLKQILLETGQRTRTRTKDGIGRSSLNLSRNSFDDLSNALDDLDNFDFAEAGLMGFNSMDGEEIDNFNMAAGDISRQRQQQHKNKQQHKQKQQHMQQQQQPNLQQIPHILQKKQRQFNSSSSGCPPTQQEQQMLVHMRHQQLQQKQPAGPSQLTKQPPLSHSQQFQQPPQSMPTLQRSPLQQQTQLQLLQKQRNNFLERHNSSTSTTATSGLNRVSSNPNMNKNRSKTDSFDFMQMRRSSFDLLQEALIDDDNEITMTSRANSSARNPSMPPPPPLNIASVNPSLAPYRTISDEINNYSNHSSSRVSSNDWAPKLAASNISQPTSNLHELGE